MHHNLETSKSSRNNSTENQYHARSESHRNIVSTKNQAKKFLLGTGTSSGSHKKPINTKTVTGANRPSSISNTAEKSEFSLKDYAN